MVGVAGKSRACHDCKRRRVKCDFQKPSCMRCEKAGRACPGYDRASIFVNRTLSEFTTTARVAIAEATSLQVQISMKHSSRLLQTFEQLQANITVPQAPFPGTFRLGAWDILRELYLPRTRSTDECEVTATSCYSWVHAVCHMVPKSNVLNQALLAFCAIQVYLAEPWSISEERAQSLYGEAVKKLIESLEESDVERRDDTLAAIVVLSTCELFILQGHESWHAHAHGISELLRERTDINDQSQLWRRLCSRLRLICVIIALVKGQRLVLNPTTWRLLVPADHNFKSLETLMDMVTDVPHLLAKPDKMASSDTNHIWALLSTYQKIATWQHCCKTNSPTPSYWAIPSRAHNPSDDAYATPLFPFALEYESLNIAILFIFSSAIMLQLLSTALLISTATSVNDLTQVESNEPWSLSQIRHEADKVARFLCQSTEFCFRLEMGTVGVQAMCHARYVMRNYFSQVGLERELAWCLGISDIGGPGLRRGIRMMLFEG
ncbi:hypothetical protein HBH98_153140 [Parastagonospora nodorum]|nr:hypothetical protein HBH53_156730 [Parastagonospora nodorum]KAH3995030.1 hypothetical protein HBI10_176510 [Parastagonospora nodorum]KAH4017581.1 hypothetical protein HBI13_142040 [Parastagonospora nodorum]KAH4063226.1 hypothetical protein HBH50_194100 [Parastagonospora nodorum]KAH4082458.1 hypothetical protein HBH48_186580 [Parastagonospora nodorum]